MEVVKPASLHHYSKTVPLSGFHASYRLVSSASCAGSLSLLPTISSINPLNSLHRPCEGFKRPRVSDYLFKILQALLGPYRAERNAILWGNDRGRIFREETDVELIEKSFGILEEPAN
jgi:hypothetical protein